MITERIDTESYSYAPQDTVSTKTVVQVVGSSVTGNQKEVVC